MRTTFFFLRECRRYAAIVICAFTYLLSPHPAQAQSSAIIDVLVVYTPAVEKKYVSYNGVRALALACVNATNKSFKDSSVPVIFRLAGVRKVVYKESTDLEEDLDRLTELADGYMDEVHDWRDSLGADMVHLIRRGVSEGVAGMAWLSISGTEASPTGLEEYAFAVTADAAALGNYVFAHEAGHNLGSRHNRTGPGSSPMRPIIPYSYGHRFSARGKEFRTIMAYEPGERLARWSNPNFVFSGQPMGVKDSVDNARAFIATGPIVAAYREGRSGGIGDMAILGSTDFRNIKPGFAARRTVQLVNRSRDKDLHIASLKLPAGISSSWRGGLIPAGSRQVVNLIYRPSGFGRNNSGTVQVLDPTDSVLAERPIQATSAPPPKTQARRR